jgi:hypothetical protein
LTFTNRASTQSTNRRYVTTIYEWLKGGWFNVFDAITQRDYRLRGNTFKIVEAANTKQKTAAADGNAKAKS